MLSSGTRRAGIVDLGTSGGSFSGGGRYQRQQLGGRTQRECQRRRGAGVCVDSATRADRFMSAVSCVTFFSIPSAKVRRDACQQQRPDRRIRVRRNIRRPWKTRSTQAAMWDTQTGTFTAFLPRPGKQLPIAAPALRTPSPTAAGSRDALAGPTSFHQPPGRRDSCDSPERRDFHLLLGSLTDLNENGWAVGRERDPGLPAECRTRTEVDIGTVEATAPSSSSAMASSWATAFDEDLISRVPVDGEAGRTYSQSAHGSDMWRSTTRPGASSGTSEWSSTQCAELFVWDGALRRLRLTSRFSGQSHDRGKRVHRWGCRFTQSGCSRSGRLPMSSVLRASSNRSTMRRW